MHIHCIPMKKLTALLLFLLLCFQASAQYFDLGTDPASVKWKQIRSRNFRIIYPAEIRDEAFRLADMLQASYLPLSASLQSKPVRISVILHNRSCESNAMVPWAPKRMEFLTCPPQDSYAQPWEDQLALHEFRHVVQLSKINTGFTRVLSWFFGQQATAAVTGLYIPFWFLEGDAVLAETAFSRSGRGRVPSFEAELRAQVLDKGIYRYNKAVFGSYRTFTPDRYVFGYHLVATARMIYGPGVWEKALRRTAQLPVMVVPFSSGIHSITGMGKNKLYRACFARLDSLWRIQDAATRLTPTRQISPASHKLYCSYMQPCILPDGRVAALRTGMNDISRIVICRNAEKDKIIVTPGNLSSNTLSAGGGKLVWAELTSDLRWENRSYSIIRVFDSQNGKTRRITRKSRYFAPDISPDGKRILAIEQTPASESFLVILDAVSGKVLKRHAAARGDFLMTPRWAGDGNNFVFLALNRSGKRICTGDTLFRITDVTAAGYTEISNPVLHNGRVYFIGAFTGIDNYYHFRPGSDSIFSLTSSRFGVAGPLVFSGDTAVVYTDYSASGYRLVSTRTDKLLTGYDPGPDLSIALCDAPGNSEQGAINFDSIPAHVYTEKKYSRILNLLNFHSWGPLSIDAENTSVKPGIQLQSQNLLSSMILSLGYDHDWNMSNSRIFINLAYRGWYPEININAAYTFRRSDSIRWDVLNLRAGVGIPVNLSRGAWYRKLLPQVFFGFYQYFPRAHYPGDAFSGTLQTLEYRIYTYNLLKTSLRDLNPRWGQILELNFRHTPFGGAELGNIFSAETMLYFPGIGKHHSFGTYAGFQNNTAGDYMFASMIASPSGYEPEGFEQEWVLKASYEMPLFYPDWSIGSLFYFKRFRASAFYDLALARGKEGWNTLQSAGASLLTDFHFLRFIAPLSIGIKATYRFSDAAIIPEFVYSVNIDDLY